MSRTTAFLVVIVGLASPACAVRSDGERLVTWSHDNVTIACAMVQDQLFEQQNPSAQTDTNTRSETRNEAQIALARDLAAYRVCEAYGNGAINASEYNKAISSMVSSLVDSLKPAGKPNDNSK